MNIYVMRHGTTYWNEKQIFQGRSNNKLSPCGKKLVEQTALQTRNIKFDVIFSSPLMRTMQTSNIINKYHNVKIVKDERLTEIDIGIFTRRKSSSLTEQEKLLMSQRASCCNMESYQSVFNRTKNFIDALKTKNFENVLIVTHKVVAVFIEYILNNEKMSLEQAKKVLGYKNAELKSFYNI